MKRFFAMLLSLALVLGLMPATVLAADVPTICQACGTTPTWEVMPTKWTDKPAGHYHYYLDKDVTPAQLYAGTDIKMDVCLDLNGHSINTNGRAMIAWYGSTINIMDSSAEGDGYICGSTGSNNTASGSLAANKNGTIRLYSGTLKFQKDDTGLGVGKGGVMCAENTGKIEILGGRVEGGELVMYSGGLTHNGHGGAIYVYNGGQLIVSGGEITSGTVPAEGQGPCVFLQGDTAKMTLSGNAKVAEICNNGNGTNLTVSGTYTGKARLKLATGKTAANGTTVAVATGADISGADLFCTNDNGYTVEKSGDNLVLKTFVPTADRHMCEHCADIVQWKPVSSNTALFAQAGQHHLYLSEDYTKTQLNAKNGAQVCLDLYGKEIYSDGRALHVAANSQISIMDSVGGGTVTGTSGSNNPTGGTLALGGANAVANIYGGTYKLVQDGTGHGVGTGGVVYMSSSAATLNMYGGKIEGGELVLSGYELTVNGYGAAVYMGSTGRLNVYGGEITSGTVPDGGLGECVYLASTTAKVTVSGSGSIEEIYAQKDTQPLHVTGTYTGTVKLRFPNEQAILENMVVGTCTGADISNSDLICTNGKGYYLANKEGNLVISSFGLDAVAAVYNSTGAAGYTSLQEAIDACTDGYVQLLKSVEGTATVTRDLYIDMNGQNATINADEGVTVYGFDSQTDDYTVSDGKYGKLTVTGGKVTGLPETSAFAEDGYLAVAEDGVYSFHRVKLEVYAMSLRGDEAGIYYKSHFLADEKAAPQLSTYGIALSVIDTPTERNLETKCVYTTFEGFESGPVGNLGNNSSTLLKGILKDTNDDAKNLRNLDMTVYGRAYAKTADGQILFGAPVSRSFREQLEAVDTILPGLSQQQVESVSGLYQKFAALLKELKLPNMTAAAQEEEKGTLKVLSLGHSHGLDGTALLYEVLDAELDQDIVVGALYYSGCSMASHAKFLTGNLPEYDYYKKDKTNVNGAWQITKETTGLYALQDEQWDVIVIQEANFNAGMENVYNKETYMTVLNYLYNNQEDRPRILFHMTWTNPDDYENYISSSSPLSHPNLSWYISTSEGRYGDENGVFQREILIDKILTYTEKYLEDCTDFLGEKYIESVIPAATAVEYAQYVCGRTNAEIYRDWTHMNDYGRLIVAYTWYAKIMQLTEVDSVKVTEVPEGAHHRNSKFPADLKFDEQMRYDALNAVNFALANPYADIANGEVTPEKPLPLDPAAPALPALLQVDNQALSLNALGQANCPVCDQEVTWTAITDTASQQVLEGGKHYYLTGDLTSDVATDGYIKASSTTPACLHLNGHNITASATSAIFATGKLNVMGEGTVSGVGTPDTDNAKYTQYRGAAVDLNDANAVVNLYGGNYTKSATVTNDVVGVFRNGGTVNLFEGVTIDVSAYASGRCVNSYYGTVNIYGGTYAGNSKSPAVHANNWSTSKSGTVMVFGGTISSTNWGVAGGGQATAHGTVQIYGGTISTVRFGNNMDGIIGGAPVIKRLSIVEPNVFTLGRLTDGASIKVDATGTFTNPSANAAAYLEKGYLSAWAAEKAITVVENALSCN